MKQIFKLQSVITYTRIKAILLAFVLVLAYAITNTQSAPKVEAAIPKYINFQGKLTNVSNGTNVADGTYNIEFKLYDASSGGTLLWTETYDNTPSPACDELQVTNGVFSAKLGTCNSLASVDFSGGSLYLSINVEGDGEMSPRKQLVSSAFAFVANSVDGDGTIDITNTGNDQLRVGYDGSNDLKVDVNSNGFTTFTSTGSGAGFNITGGNVGIGTSSLAAKLHVTSTTEQLRLAYDASNYSSFTTSSSGDLTVAPSGGDLGITGNIDISGTIAVGTADAFTVNSNGTVTIAAGQSYTGAGAVTVSSGSATQLTIDSGTTGTLAIGTDSSAETINIGTGSAAKAVTLGSTNSTSSTVVQSGSGNVQIQANGTSTGAVYVGTVGTTTTPDLLVLGTKSDAGNPTGIDGAMYYNSSGKFMIYEAGAWKELCNKTDAACGAGSGANWNALMDPTANLSLNMNEYTTTFAWDTAATAATRDYLSLAVTNDASTDVNVQRLLVLSNANATGSTATERLLVLDNADLDELVTTAIEVTSAAGGITTAVDVSDSDIVDALNVGSNNIVGTTAVIDFTNFDVSSAGALTAVGVNSGSGLIQGSGGVTVTGTAQINATGSAATTIGNSSAGALAMQGSTVAVSSNGASNDITLTSADQIILNSTGTIELQDNTNVTGNLDVSGTLTAGTADAFTVSSAGTVTIAAGQSYTGAGAVTVSSGTATALTLNSGTTGAINIGTDSSAETISIGNGAADKTLVLGSTNTNSTTTLQSGLGGIIIDSGTTIELQDSTNITGSLSVSTLAGGGTQCVQVNNTGVLSGTGASCGTSSIAWNALTAPTGNLTLAMDADTTTFNWDTLTTGTGFTMGSSSLTSGTVLRVESTGTAATTGNKALQVVSSGNLGTSQTIYGVHSVVNRGSNAINVAGYFEAAGGTNYAIITGGGNVGIGDSTPSSLLTVGSGDLFQVNSAGRITAVVGIVSTDDVTISSSTAADNRLSIGIGNGQTGNSIRISENISGSFSALTGNLIEVNNTRTLGSGTINDSSRYLNITRNSETYSSGNMTISGNLANLASTCVQTAGTCTDTAKILQLTQGYSSASGAVLDIDGAGTGNLIDADATNASANGALIDIQSSSSSQYALNVTSNNGATTGLIVLGNGNVGIGDATPAAMLTVGSADAFQVNSSGAIAAATGVTSSGTITFSGLGGGGTQCVTTSNTGVLGVAACGSAAADAISVNGTAVTDGSGANFIDTAASATVAATTWSLNTGASPDSVTIAIGAASGTDAGIVTANAQTFGGAKTFSATPIFSTMTAGSMLFAGTSGTLSQDNANLFWDDANNELGIGTNSPSANLTVLGTARVGNDANGQSYEEANYGNTVIGLANNVDFTATSGASYGGFNSINFTPSAASSANLWSFNSSVAVTGSNNATGQYVGITGNAIADTTGSVNSLIGGTFDAYSVAATAVTGMRGVIGSVSIDAGSVTTAYGLQAAGYNDGTLTSYSGAYIGEFSGLGTTTSVVGIELQDQIEGTNNTNLLIKPLASAIPTGNYSIYNSSTDNNYFAGNLGLGDTSPAALLTVGNGDLFQVNSSGAIAAATGIVSSGTIQFSSLTTNGALYTTGGNGTLTTTAPTSGAIGYWSRTGTTLSATTANDVVSIATTNTTGADLAITNTGVYTGTGIFNLTANSATTGVVQNVSATALTTGSALRITGSTPLTTNGELLDLNMGAATAGNGAIITTTGVYTGTGLQVLTANSATTGVGQAISMTGLTTGSGIRVTGGTSMAANGELLDLNMGAATAGNGLNLTTTGVYTGTGLQVLTANSATTGLGIALSMTGLTTGSGIRVTGGTAMAANGELLDLNMGAATAGNGSVITTTGVYTGTGLSVLTANSATTGTIQAISSTGLTTGTAQSVTMGTALTTGGALSVTGASYNPGAGATGSLVSLAFTNAGTNTTSSATVNGINLATTLNTSGATGTKATNAINVAAPTYTACTGGTCTWNGVQISNTASTSQITSTAMLITGASSGSAGTQLGLDITGITAGAATETALRIGAGWDNYLDTASLDITGAGAITGATGVTSSGTITFSGLTADRLVTTTTGGQLTTSISSANLALSVSDETGTAGNLVFSSGPTLTNVTINSGLTLGTALTVANGGTGATTFTSNGVLYGNGTGAVQATAAGTTGQCLVGNTGSAPSWSSCSGLVTLQNAYDATSGNTITTTTGRNVAITLAEVASPTSFTIENQDTAATSAQRIFNSIATGTATNGLLIEQTGAGTMTNAIQIAETAGTITDGILITGTLGNILNSGSIDITGAGAITGATGITSATGDITATAGNVAITAGALTLNGTTRISNAGVGSFITGTTIGSQTFTTNNISDSGALTVNATNAALTLQTTTSGNIVMTPASSTTVINGANYAMGTGSANLVINSTTTAAANIGGSLAFAQGGTNYALISGRTDGAGGNPGYLAFETRNGSNVVTEAMRIDSSQRIGIGTSTTTNGRLTVSNSVGGIAALRVDQAGGPDGGTTYGIYSGITGSATNSGTYVAGYLSSNVTSAGANYALITGSGNVGIGESSPTALFTVGSGDLFQVNSSGAIAAVVGITNTGAQSTTVQSTTALTVARTGTNYALQVDTNTASSETGIKITSAAAGNGVAVSTISSGTNENLTIDAKGSGTITLAGTSTGNVLIGQSGVSGTIANSQLLNVGASGGTANVAVNATNTITLNGAPVGVGNTLTVGNTSGSLYYETELNGNLDVHIRTGTEPYYARFIHHQDANPMLQINTDSSLNWGAGGASAVDTNLYRSGASILATDDAFDVGGTLQAGSSNVTLTLATGFIDADAITLITSGGTGATASVSGLQTVSDGLGLLQGCSDGQVLKWDDSVDVRWECAADTSGAASLQDSYNGGNTIETAAATPVIITETTTGAMTGDLLQLTVNQATGGTFAGDALQITMDGTDANAFTGNGINIVVDQSQNTGSPILVQDDAAVTLFQLSENGAVTFGAAAAETTALTITDTDYTNALSIGDNAIVGTTANIDLTNFDVVGSSGNITTAGTLAVNGGTISSSSATLVVNAAGAVDIQDNVTVDSLTADTGNVAITAGALTLNGTTRISNAGVGSFITGTTIGSQTFTTNNISDSGALTVNATNAALTLQTTTSGNVILNSAGGTIELQDNTNITGNLDVSGTLIAGTANAFQVSSGGAVTAVGVNSGSGLIQGTGGLTLTGAISVTNNGTSTIDLNTGTSTGQVTIGGGSGTFSLQTSNIDISNTGAITGATGIVSSGTIQFSSLTTNGALYTTGGNGTLTTTAPTSGAIGYWSRTGTILSPATTNDTISLTSTTSPQLTIAYDGSNNYTTSVSSAGAVTFNATGASAGFIFSDTISSPGAGANSERFGASSAAAGSQSIAIGNGASAATDFSIAIGYSAATTAGTNYEIAIGHDATATGQLSLAVGASASVTAASSVAIGSSSSASVTDSVAIGVGASGAGGGSVAIGRSAAATYAGNGYQVAIGGSSNITGQLATGVGHTAVASHTGATVLGANTTSGGNYSIALGYGTSTTAANQFVAGGSAPITEVYFGNGVQSTAPYNYAIYGTSVTAGTADTAGGSVTIAGGKGTGTGNGGSILFQTANPGTTGSSQNSLGTRMAIDGATGYVGIGTTSPTNNLQIGTLASTSTATPVTLSLGGTYTNSGGSNPKLKIFESGGVITGFGTDFDGLEYFTFGGGNHQWFVGSTAYMTLDSSGYLGVGTTGPDRRIDILDASNPQLRLTYTDGSVYTDLQTTSAGELYINPSGSNVGIGTNNPDARLWVNGTTNNNTAFALVAANSSGTDILTVRNDGYVGINYNTPIGSEKLRVQGGTALVGTTSDSSAYGLQVYNSLSSDHFVVRNDGYVGLSYNGPAGNERLRVYGGAVRIDGPQTRADWGLEGQQLQAAAVTYTNSSTAASGTATNAVFNSFAQPTLAATNASVTTTNAATVYIGGAPAAGTNQTITNSYGLWSAGKINIDTGSVADSARFVSSDATAYNAASFQSTSRLNLFSGNGTGAHNLIRFSGTSNNEAFFGTVQNASGYAEFLWKSYNGSYAERMRIDSNGNLTITDLAGVGNRCVEATSTGELTVAASACGTGGGMSIGGTVTSGTTGSILFVGGSSALAQDNANFFFDDASNELGIGTNAPNAALEVVNTTSPQLRVGYDTSTNYFTAGVSSAGAVTFNANGASAGFIFSDYVSRPGSGTDTQIFGPDNTATGSYSTLLGKWISAGSNGYVTTMGVSTVISGTEAVAIGYDSRAGAVSTAIGTYAYATASNALAVGNNAQTTAADSVVLGYGAYSTFADSVAIGKGTLVRAANQLVFGSDTAALTSVFFGEGVYDASPLAVTLNGTGGNGSNIAGANLQLAGGMGTGTGNGGNLLFQVAYPTTSGSSQNSLTTVATFNADNNDSSGVQSMISLTPTINQSSTAGYRALDINVTETATGSIAGMNRLADLRVGGSSKLAIANTGSLLLQDAANIVSPYGSMGRFQNILVQSENFTTTWTTSSITAFSANTQTAPDGSTTAESLATSGSGGYVQQDTSTAVGSTYTFSVWVRSATGTQNFGLRIDGTTTGTGTEVTHTATTSWQRFSVTQNTTGFTGNVRVRIYPGTTAGTGTVYAWGAQLEQSSTANAYAYTTTGALTNVNRGSTLVSNFATQSGFTYGGRQIINLEGAISASSTLVGQMIRVNDNATGTDDTATVRALEVQAYSGSNINGINTGIASFGYTFGVHAVTTAQANEAAQPAALFADLDNGSATTQGNAIRAYTNNATSADLVSFYQETSSFSGNGLEMNFGNSGGTFSGNFMSLQVAGTEYAKIDAEGNAFFSLRNTGTEAVCHVGNDAVNNDELTSCSGSPVADYAEMYPVAGNVEYGDVVIAGTQMINTYDMDETGAIDWNKVKGAITQLVKSNGGYNSRLIGVVSDNYGDFSSTGYNVREQDNPKPVALSGRVLVKVTNENGVVKAGDYLTTSATQSGKAMKATQPGMMIGMALSGPNAQGMAMVYVNTAYGDPGVQLEGDSTLVLHRGVATTKLITATQADAAYIIEQEGTGDLLQLKSDGIDRLLVANNGSLSLNTTPVDDAELILDVKVADTSKFSINARGDIAVSGVIVIRDDSFAGSVATQEDGTAEITFTYHLGTGKPVVQLTAEAQIPVFAQIVEFKQDDDGNYTGFVIKTFDLISGPISAIVHYNVTAKQDGYITYGEVLGVQDSPENMGSGDEGLIIQDGEVINGDGQTTDSGSNNGETIETTGDSGAPAGDSGAGEIGGTEGATGDAGAADGGDAGQASGDGSGA